MLRYFGELTKGSLAAFAINCSGLIFVFLLQILLTHILPQSEYGTYQYILSWATLLMVFSLFGFDASLAKLVPALRSEGENSRIRGLLISSALTVIALSLLLASAVSFGLPTLIPSSENTGTALLVLIGLVPVLSLAQLRQAWLRSLKQIAAARFPDVVLRPIITSALLVIAWLLLGEHITAIEALLCLGAGAGIGMIAGSRALDAALSEFRVDEKASTQLKKWIPLSFRFVLISGATILLSEIDKLVLGMLRPPEEIALYAIAAQVGLLILFGFDAVGTILAPLISEKKGDRDELRSLLRRSNLGTIVLTLPAAILIIAFAPNILGVFGDAYLYAEPVLLILAICLAAHVLLGPGGFVLTMSGYEKAALYILAGALVANCLVNIPLIYFFGAKGAALSTGAIFILRAYAFRLYAKRKLGIEVSALNLFLKHRDTESAE